VISSFPHFADNSRRMLNVSELELDHALAAIRGHGYGDFFPEPPELRLLTTNWAQIRPELARPTLDRFHDHQSDSTIQKENLVDPSTLAFEDRTVLQLDVMEIRCQQREFFFGYTQQDKIFYRVPVDSSMLHEDLGSSRVDQLLRLVLRVDAFVLDFEQVV
jgi:hypothetical protein